MFIHGFNYFSVWICGIWFFPSIIQKNVPYYEQFISFNGYMTVKIQFTCTDIIFILIFDGYECMVSSKNIYTLKKTSAKQPAKQLLPHVTGLVRKLQHLFWCVQALILLMESMRARKMEGNEIYMYLCKKYNFLTTFS